MSVPAYETKHLPELCITLDGVTYRLTQSNTSNETGSTLWLSSQILSAYMSLQKKKKKKLTLLELGSGIGLTSLVCHTLGYTVTASDYGAIVPLLAHNIELNGKKKDIKVETIDWCHLDNNTENTLPLQIYNVVVLSDVIYVPELLPCLVKTILRFVDRKSTVYVAQEVRSPHLMQQFLDLCAKSFRIQSVSGEEIERCVNVQLQSTTQNQDEQADWSGVVIYKMKLKAVLSSTLS